MRSILLTLFLILNSSLLKAGDYNFRNYTNKDGLSHNTVFCSLQDSRGYMWFGTEEGLNRFDGYNFQVFKYNPQDSSGLPGNCIQSLFEDSDGKVWVCTTAGLCYYDYPSNSFITNFSPFENEPNVYFSFVREDKDRNLWFMHGNLLVTYSLQNGTIRHFPAGDYFHAWNIAMNEENYPFFSDGKDLHFYQSSNHSFTRFPILTDTDAHISAVCEIPETGILIGTDREGVKLYRYHNQEIEQITPFTQVRTITQYNRNIYWIGTESGIYIYDVVNRTLENLTKSLTNEYAIADNAIYSISRDIEGGIWVGSFFGGISYLPQEYISFTPYIGGKTAPGLLGNAVREICPDQYGNLWIGTEDNGVNKYDPTTRIFTNYSLNNPAFPLSATNIHGVYAEGDKLWVGTYNRGIDVLDIPSGKIIKHYDLENTGRELQSDFILCFYRTSGGKFLIGSSTGTIEFDEKTNQFQRWHSIREMVRQIYEDRKNNIWVVTLNGLYKYKAYENQLVRYMSDSKNLRTLPNNSICSIFEDSKGTIWVTTLGGLARYDEVTDSFERIYSPNAFSSNIFYRMLEDDNGLLWISTANGLIQFNPDSYEFKTYSYNEGLHESQFNFSSSYKSPDGTLFFGTINGMISFNPRDFRTDNFVPPLYIEHPLTAEGKKQQTIKLPYNHTPFTLTYSALSFTSPQTIQYAYQLEGIDKEWNYVNKNREVTFANLSPGKYMFKVKSTNSSGIWQENITTLPIVVVPPFWATGWALVFYICLIIAIIYIVYEYKKKDLEKQHLRNQEIFENKKEKELYDAKIQFFTYITHEIRTPLTLIKAPLEKIMQKNDGSPQTDEYLQIIDKNTHRLLDLSTQLLDFRRTETKGFQLNFVKTDIHLWIDTILTRFHTTLEGENKQFIYKHPEQPLTAYIDREALAKITSNLLTNAFKYSQNYIRLDVNEVVQDQDFFEIRVINDGTLIPIQEKENIFTPFYRLKDNETKPGSGIGLSLVQSLVELHKGSIRYEHTEDGMNQFVLTFPIAQTNSLHLEEPENKKEDTSSYVQEGKGPLILVVEDQKDMRHFIARELSGHFRVAMAENGQQALEILKEEPVEGIISDIMMPVMDGYDLCNEVKNNIHFSHIPVILLTAQHNLQSRLKGLNKGADAYIEKPFSLELLVTQTQNLLKNREIIKSAYREKPHVDSSSLALSKMDALFLERVNAFIEENLSNEQLNVDMLAAEMGMSTSSLYRKVKGISGLSPVEFIRVTRLKKAVQWMEEGEFRINEIAFMSGFSSPAYFSTCFQKQYGKTPSEFLKELS